MALRNQPYLPLYVQDFSTDEKLMECSAAATGVFVRLMCLMHKSDEYGKILLKQKDKQTNKQVLNFASKVAKHFPYVVAQVESAIQELVDEGVLQIDGDYLIQKRMVKDAQISDARSKSGSGGGKNTQKKNKEFASTFAKAKSEANTEYEIESASEDGNDIGNGVKGEKPSENRRSRKPSTKTASEKTLVIRMEEEWKNHLQVNHDIAYYADGKNRAALKQISSKLLYQVKERLRMEQKEPDQSDDQYTMESWRIILGNYALWDDFDKKFTELTQINSRLSNILSSIKKSNHGDRIKFRTSEDQRRDEVAALKAHALAVLNGEGTRG